MAGKKIHVWAENESTEVYLLACFDLNEEWYIPRGILSDKVQLRITYEEEGET